MSSLANGLQILKLFNADRPILRVNEVSSELGLPKSSVSRLLSELAQYGFAERDTRGGYMAGVVSLAMRESYFANRSLFREIDQVLERLVERFPFTALAATRSGADLVIVNTKQGSHPLRVVSAVGAVLPAEETTQGLCLLARLDDVAAQKLIEDTGRKVGPDFVQKLEAAREQGYLAEASRRTKSVNTVGSAIISREGEGIAFCLTYPTSEGDALRPQMVQQIAESAAEIGRRFGDVYWLGQS